MNHSTSLRLRGGNRVTFVSNKTRLAGDDVFHALLCFSNSRGLDLFHGFSCSDLPTARCAEAILLLFPSVVRECFDQSDGTISHSVRLKSCSGKMCIEKVWMPNLGTAGSESHHQHPAMLLSCRLFCH